MLDDPRLLLTMNNMSTVLTEQGHRREALESNDLTLTLFNKCMTYKLKALTQKIFNLWPK